MNRNKSFSKRLSLYLLTATVVLFVISMLAIGISSFKFIYNSAVKEASSQLDNTILDIEKVFTEIETRTHSYVWLIEEYHDNQTAIAEMAVNLVSQDSNILSCAIGYEPFQFNEDDVYFCPFAYNGLNDSIELKIMGSADYDYHLMDWYLIPKMLGHGYWSEPAFDSEGSGKLVASYSLPLYHDDGRFFGVIKSDIDLEWLTAKISAIKPYENSYTVLAGRNGAFISHMDRSKILTETVFTSALESGSLEGIELGKNMVSGKKGVYNFNQDGKKGIIIYGPMTNGWSSALICTYDDIFHKSTIMNLISILVAILTLLLLYWSNKSIIERVTQPLTEFTYSALNIAQGNFNARIPEIKTEDELRRLHDALHYVEVSISRYISELRSTTASNERFESELNIAASIQMQMLQKDFPTRNDVDLYAALSPAKEVGGDLYDYFINEKNQLYFCVGDVSGKGVPAALYMAITRSAFRFIAGMGLPVEDVVYKINNAFCDGNDSGMFVTMFVGCIDLETLEMKYCNAGHNPILVVNPDGYTKYLHAKPNIAAGLFQDFPYQPESLQLEKGTRLIIYTDGVTEAEDKDKELYGETRLERFAQTENCSESSEQYVDALRESIKAFTLDNPQNDDITMMSIKIK